MNRELIEFRPNCVPDASNETVFYSIVVSRCETSDGKYGSVLALTLLCKFMSPRLTADLGLKR